MIISGRFKGNPANIHDQELEGRWGFIDRTGRVVIRLDPQTDFAGGFVGGLAPVRLKDGSVGYINSKGNYVWNPTK